MIKLKDILNEAITNPKETNPSELAKTVLGWFDFYTDYIDDGGQRRRAIQKNDNTLEWFNSHPIDIKQKAYKMMLSQAKGDKSKIEGTFGKQLKESVIKEDTRRVKLLGIDFKVSEMNGRIFFSFVDKKAATIQLRQVGTNKIVNHIQKRLDIAFGKGEFFFKGGDHAEFQNGYLFQRNTSDINLNKIKFESVNEATLTEKKYYVTYNKGRGQGKGLEKEFDQKSFKTTDKPKVFNSYNDAKKYAEKMEKMFQHSIGGGTAYWVSDEKMNQIKESVNEESYKVAGRPVTLIKGKKSDATDWKVKFQNGKETSLSDVLALIKPFPKGVHWRYKNLESVNESDLKGYLAADVVDDIVKSIGSKFVSGEIKNAPNKNYIYLKLTDIKFGNDVIKMLKSKFGIDAKIDKTFGNIPSVSFASKKVVSEAKSDYAVYHKTYTSAIQSAREYAEKKGYEIDDDDSFRQIGMGPKKPSDGKTNRFSIQLTKDGKPQKKHLHIQVYGMGTYKRNPDGSKTRSLHGGQNEYELNAYIN